MKTECDYCGQIYDLKDLEDTDEGLACKRCLDKGDYYANVAEDRDVDAYEEQR